MAYGLLGLPLAFVALPLYVHLPNFYATEYGMSLATLGAVLLFTRLLDALTDPFLGRFSDFLHRRSVRAVLTAGGVSALLLLLGMAGLFGPPDGVSGSPAQLVVWVSLGLLLTYTAFSLLSIAHQSWGARLGGDELYRARVVAWREAAGLIGVVMASVLPALLGWNAWLAAFALTLGLGWLAWTRAPQPERPEAQAAREAAAQQPQADALPLWDSLRLPWTRSAFRRLMAVFVLSGMGSAIPATLVLFFIKDRLLVPEMEPAFLATYFVCAAASIPLWLRLVKRWGLARTWLAGMLLAISVFGWTATLGAGDHWYFLVVCALSGIALGTDLALPGALLAGVIGQQKGDSGRYEGAYFGWWNLAAKLNLALAAGLALPFLGAMGYQPGTTDPEGLRALALVYAVLPCILKLMAAGLLYLAIIRPQPFSTPPLKEST